MNLPSGGFLRSARLRERVISQRGGRQHSGPEAENPT